MGRKTQMTDRDMGTWDYEWDDASNLKRQKDARGQHVCFYCDQLNRLTGEHYRTDANCLSSPTLNVQYVYDATVGGNKGLGYRTSMIDASGSTHWKYDDRGRVISETRRIDTAKYWTQWTYDPQDRVRTQTYPGGDAGQAGEVVTTAYGKWGHPATLTGAGSRQMAEGLPQQTDSDCLGPRAGVRTEPPATRPPALHLGPEGMGVPSPSSPARQRPVSSLPWGRPCCGRSTEPREAASKGRHGP